MIPQQFTGNEMLFDNRADSGYRTGLRVDIGTIAAGSEAVRSFRIYLGEKDKELLGAVDEKIVAASDVSTLIEPIRYFVIWALMGINRLFNNLGWSLVIFSILTKIVFMPLTKKSTDSMKRCRRLLLRLKNFRKNTRINLTCSRRRP
jgi:YidC/Oxa1 family membrane protein insertase